MPRVPAIDKGIPGSPLLLIAEYINITSTAKKEAGQMGIRTGQFFFDNPVGVATFPAYMILLITSIPSQRNLE